MIRLNHKDVSFMLDKLELSSNLTKLLKNIMMGGIICDSVADELRNLCNDRLDMYGFDINYELTDEGKKLQELVDKLYVN